MARFYALLILFTIFATGHALPVLLVSFFPSKQVVRWKIHAAKLKQKRGSEAQWDELARQFLRSPTTSSPRPRTPSPHRLDEAQSAALATERPPSPLRAASPPTTSKSKTPPADQQHPVRLSQKEHDDNLHVWLTLALRYQYGKDIPTESGRSRSRSPQRSASPVTSKSRRGNILYKDPVFDFNIDDLELLTVYGEERSLPQVVPGKTRNKRSWENLWALFMECAADSKRDVTGDSQVPDLLEESRKAVASRKQALLAARLLGQQLYEVRASLEKGAERETMKGVMERLKLICKRHQDLLDRLVKSRKDVKLLGNQTSLAMKSNLVAQLTHLPQRKLKLDLKGIPKKVLEGAIVL